jgi:ADP-ribose pyrophosphatase YjhB (NUDIX family)
MRYDRVARDAHANRFGVVTDAGGLLSRSMVNFVRRIPDGDTLERSVCATCGFVDYQNPRIIVGSVVSHDGRVLLCRRAIEPRRGFWTLPAGFMELGETAEEGARREAMEEARAAIEIEGLLAVFSISRIGQVQLIFRARFADPAAPYLAAGPESLEVRLFDWDAIPRSDIAFPSVHWSLAAWSDSAGRPLGAPAGNPRSDARGAAPPQSRVEAEGL